MNKPTALLVYPPVYDFALYDLFLKPYGLLRVGRLLSESGYRVRLINSLDYRDRKSIERLGRPRRKNNGTGKLFREVTDKPGTLRGFSKRFGVPDIERHFARYGVLSEVIEEQFRKEHPDIVFVSSGMTYWYLGVKEIVDLSRRVYPDVPIVLGGVYATLCFEHALRNLDVDIVIPESNISVLNIFLKRKGFPPVNDSYDVSRLNPLLLEDIFSDSAVVMLNTGCPFRCRYCASFRMYDRFLPGDPESTVRLILEIHNRFGTKNFAFYDDALLFRKRELFLPFIDMVLQKDLGLNFYLPNGIHLSYLDFEIADKMFRAGFREIRLGLESSLDSFHSREDKKLVISDFGEKIDLLRRVGFRGEDIGVYILAGLPRQYAEEVEETIRFVSKFGVRVYVSEYSPVPGTPMFEESVTLSAFPIAEEPLFQNNTIFPMQWEGFTLEDLENLKVMAREVTKEIVS